MSGGSNQRTLFQTWGAPVPQNKAAPPKKDGKKSAGVRKGSSSNSVQVATAHPPRNPLWTEIGQDSSENPVRTGGEVPENEDDDDDLMVVAVYEAERSLQLDSTNLCQPPALPAASSSTQTYPDLPGCDSSSAKVWIYPTNYPLREYQLKMSEVALFQNTLVCLPTGLGKTFIASVVMYNFYRWYPAGKIVFMAPTKPLVAQQIEACYNVMGIPQAHMAELTGSTAAKQRQDVWRSKRVFFLTPQVMVNDLSRETCPAKQIKCVVIDEAHKALGNHAYCQVIRQLCSQTLQFRVLALSATPGGDTKSVQSVISNLLISHIELRSEESPDIQAHSHQRSVDKVVVPLGEALSAHQARYLQVLEKFMSRLVQNRVMSHKDLRTLSKYQIILARDQFRKNPPPSLKGPQQGMLEGDFALCISLYHGYELLMQMGLRSLFFYIQGIMDGSREMSRARNELQRTPTFMDLYREMEAKFVKPLNGPDEPFIYSHPKLEKLEEVVLRHFRVWAESSPDNNGPQGVSTRVMIFSSFRESVQEIAAMLDRHAPLIRVMTFMGQASAGKGVKGFTQKEQLEVVRRFRQGGFNTLVSTCVGEEGLDIGEVDLIVCFDAQKNPIRLVQRMGRTGRKRQGRIVVILAEGREERTYNQSQSNKRSVYKSITGNQRGFHMYPSSPRMLPEGVSPTLHKMHITCGQFDHGETSRRSVRGRRSHSEGRTSLIHPQNLIHQGGSTSDGFLSSTEYAVWESTMKLDEHEAHPTLRPSHFMSIPNDPPLQEDVSGYKSSSRELSLWEWRHWQHKALPSHVVDHSLRCNHFIKVMELIDGMREENEGECRYEQELLPYLHGDDTGKSRRKKQKTAKICPESTREKSKASRSSLSELEYIDEEMEEGNTRALDLLPTFAVKKQRLAVARDAEAPCKDVTDDSRPEADRCNDDDCTIVNVTKAEHTPKDPVIQNDNSQIPKNDEDLELQAMFYLPSWDSAPLIHSNKLSRDESLMAICANVAELLSRSPPSVDDILEAEEAAPLIPSLPKPLHQPFLVSFTLDVDDDDDDDDEEGGGAGFSRDSPEASLQKEDSKYKQPVSAAARSPTWDELFEDEEVSNNNNFREEGCDHVAAEGNKDIETLNDGRSDKNHDWNIRTDEVVLNPTEGDVKDDGASRGSSPMDGSIDLFEDDEVFMQMTIPDIPTPEDDITPPTSAKAENNNNDTEKIPPLSSDRLQTVQINTLAQTKHRTCATNETFITQDRCKTADTPVQNKPTTDASHIKSPKVQENPEPVNISQDFFSLNFDLGYSLEDSEDETGADAVPEPGLEPTVAAVSNSSTPGCCTESKPRMPSENRSSKRGALPSPIAAVGARRTLMPRLTRPVCSNLKRPEVADNGSRQEAATAVQTPPHPGVCDSDSEEEVVLLKRKPHNRVNPLSSPETSKISSDVDSPLLVKKKRASALDTSDEIQGETVSDDDFQNDSTFTHRSVSERAEGHRVQQARGKKQRPKGRHFLDEEAELSEDEDRADVSSDEEDGEDQNQSLDGFVVDNTHLSQGLDDSEMQGVYLKSVRSPAVQGKFKMSYGNRNMDVFSQVPEMDETYAEDSFVVGSDEEELDSSEEEAEDVDLLPEATFVNGKRQYATRRRVFLHKVRAEAGTKHRAESPPGQRTAPKTKRSRVVRVDDSSDEEVEEVTKETSLITGASIIPLQSNTAQAESSRQKTMSSASSTLAAKVSLLRKEQKSSVSDDKQKERGRQSVENQHLLSDELDFVESEKQCQSVPATTSAPQKNSCPAPPVSVCILVDSRCISSGVELMTSLRQRHAATVHVCSLDGSYFIVSNRMAVERHSQAELAGMQNRKRLAERVSSLQGLFERVCLIVEKDRTRAGEASRPFQRTRYYDSTLAALVRTGVRLLWSDGAEESAGLLADLAQLERRKGWGITVPLEVKGAHRHQVLQLYSSLPSVSYVHALNLSHNFSSVAHLINSSIEAIEKGGCVSRLRAEEIYRFLRYSCDSFLINTSRGKIS
ncbi:Fanconi anemia group M protein [Cololabis saira]|uniref:Fanconi anemia group M protein n=1 Tax=Cololabis saira TaxID=129043 RepID=UPI002AD2E23B|nr:Fanconi anemia group M protein [Cololabis saira]